MRRGAVAIAWVVACVVLWGCAEEVAAPAEELNRVRVVHAVSGEPVAGLELHVFGLSPEAFAERAVEVAPQHQAELWLKTLATVTTDAAGEVVLSELAVGVDPRAFVFAQRGERGEVLLLASELRAQGGTWRAPREIKLGDPAASLIEGVVSEGDQPLADHRVIVSCGGFFPLLHLMVLTDEAGRYRVSGLDLIDLHGSVQRVVIALDRMTLPPERRERFDEAIRERTGATEALPVQHAWRKGLHIRQDFRF